MDFIERLLGLSPDGGSGATELAIFMVPVQIVLILVVRRYSLRSFIRDKTRA